MPFANAQQWIISSPTGTEDIIPSDMQINDQIISLTYPIPTDIDLNNFDLNVDPDTFPSFQTWAPNPQTQQIDMKIVIAYLDALDLQQ